MIWFSSKLPSGQYLYFQRSVLIHHRIRRVDHGVETNRQREKVGVILLEMLHIEDPFPDYMTENPPYVAIEVFFVAQRNTIERLASLELFNEMKRCGLAIFSWTV